MTGRCGYFTCPHPLGTHPAEIQTVPSVGLTAPLCEFCQQDGLGCVARVGQPTCHERNALHERDVVLVRRDDLRLLLYGFDNPDATALGSRPIARLRQAGRLPAGECEVAAGYRAPRACCAPDTDPPAEGCTASTVANAPSGLLHSDPEPALKCKGDAR